MRMTTIDIKKCMATVPACKKVKGKPKGVYPCHLIL